MKRKQYQVIPLTKPQEVMNPKEIKGDMNYKTITKSREIIEIKGIQK